MHIVWDGLELLNPKDKRSITSVISKVLKAASMSAYSINIALVDEATMKDLYFRFKKKKKITDVLSFPVPDTEKLFPHTQYLLGDVVVCLPQAYKQASELGHSLREELAVLCAHGLLHLLGYDHERSKEEACIQMQGEMYLLEMAGLNPALSLISRV